MVAPSPMRWVSRNSDTQKAPPGMHRREAQGGSREVAICKPRREASGEISPADTVSLDLTVSKLISVC